MNPDAILDALEGWAARLELGRVERLLEHLGRPDASYASVLVSGTNGKGSTSSLLASMATAAGYRTGLFTSPHLEGVEERLRLDGRAIDRAQLADLLEEILERARGASLELPTYFEALTVAAVLWFERAGVDLAVFEVGLGGRLDATNVVDPVISVVAEIGIDHAKVLGGTLDLIAREKAGIFRPGVVALSGASHEEARGALRERAAEIGAVFREVEGRFGQVSAQVGENGQTVRVESRDVHYELSLGLRGRHQVRNLLLALAAAEELAVSGWSGLDRAAIERGVRRCRWPGRLEKVVLPGGKVVWLDVAHNPQGAQVLAEFIVDHVGDHDLLFGILADKDAPSVLDALAPAAARVTLTTPLSDRAMDPQLLVEWLPDRAGLVEPDPSRALDRALEGDLPLVVCGSLYLVGWARTALRERFGVPPAASEPVIAADDQA